MKISYTRWKNTVAVLIATCGLSAEPSNAEATSKDEMLPNPGVVFSGFFGGGKPSEQRFYLHLKTTEDSGWDEGKWFKLGARISAGTLVVYDNSTKRLTIQPSEGASFDLVLNEEGGNSSTSVSRSEALKVLEDFLHRRALSDEDASLASKFEVVTFEDFSAVDKEKFGPTRRMILEKAGSSHVLIYLEYKGEIHASGISLVKPDYFSPEVMAALTEADWIEFQSARALQMAHGGLVRKVKKRGL